MARIEVPAGDGREATRIWQLAPHMGVGLSGMSEAVYVHSSLAVRERGSLACVSPSSTSVTFD